MLVAILILGLHPALHAATFSASLDRNVIRVGEQVQLTLRFEGGQPSGVPRLPDIPNLQIQFGGQQQQISIVNGQRAASLLLNYVVTPSAAGDYTIPAFQVPVGGAMLPSQPLTLKVHPAAAKLPDTEAYRQLTFVKLRAAKTNVFVGEPFLVEVRLYLNANASEIQMPTLGGDGFTLAPFQNQRTQEQVGNSVLNVIVFRTSATAVKAGKLPFGPAQCSLNLHVRSNGGDTVFDLFNRGVRAVPVTILSDPLEVNVLPLPSEGRPADFNGAVGSFQMSVSAAPLEVAVGDPITLRIQVSGRGGFDGVPMPSLEHWRDFKTYPPSVKTDVPDPLNAAGSKIFEQVVQPQSAELKELPAFSFSFFDPDARGYRTLKQPAFPLKVRAAAAAQAPTVVMTTTNTPGVTTELVHIKPQLGVIIVPGTALQRPAFWALTGGPLALWMALLVRRKQAEHLANNPRLRRRREVEKLVAEGLVELRKHATSGAGEPFYAALFRLLQEQLGERLDLPASAITEEVIDERIKPLGASDATRASLHELFQICNAARYAPKREPRELTKLTEQLAALVIELRKLGVAE